MDDRLILLLVHEALQRGESAAAEQAAAETEESSPQTHAQAATLAQELRSRPAGPWSMKVVHSNQVCSFQCKQSMYMTVVDAGSQCQRASWLASHQAFQD